LIRKLAFSKASSISTKVVQPASKENSPMAISRCSSKVLRL
jgi:hypothetical protein